MNSYKNKTFSAGEVLLDHYSRYCSKNKKNTIRIELPLPLTVEKVVTVLKDGGGVEQNGIRQQDPSFFLTLSEINLQNTDLSDRDLGIILNSFPGTHSLDVRRTNISAACLTRFLC